ncbi:thioredoxin domain-containing protein [Candidatus Saccharibacteria bacterium]|nr:thioredoxin domain-containing protein [Candidatus Saccharibacteria bacterium]
MKKVFRIIGVVAVVAVLIAAIVSSMNNKPSNAERIWDERTTMGNLEAKNYYIIYSDLVCPYCIAFENAMAEHEEELKTYLEENDILLEVRLSDFLYEYGETNPEHSRYSAIATYCARDEGKFWEYYDKAVTRVWNDYFKGNGKSGFTGLNKNGPEYWTKIGEDIGLGDEFKSCIKEERPLEEIEKNAEKTANLAQGMPYFKFNSFTTSGFDLSWGWDYVQKYFEAGLEK